MEFQECNVNYFKDMKKLVKTIAFFIFWTHIMHEGHMYLYNLLKNQYLQEKTLTFIICIYELQS